jgi:exopolysaccharide production repressor protein
MSFPRFLMGMLGALAAFAIFTFAATQSLWTTVWQTLVCAVLIQIGYFGAVLVLVSRQKRGVSDSGGIPDQVAPQERSVEPLARVGRPREL